MYILDTDHLSILDRGGDEAQGLSKRLKTVPPTQIATSIISYEEQMRGWLEYIAKAQKIEQQVEAYKRLRQQLSNYCKIPILEFDQKAAREFQILKDLKLRIGTMDLKIASIALANQAIVLTRNARDFNRVVGLSTENWIT